MVTVFLHLTTVTLKPYPTPQSSTISTFTQAADDARCLGAIKEPAINFTAPATGVVNAVKLLIVRSLQWADRGSVAPTEEGRSVRSRAAQNLLKILLRFVCGMEVVGRVPKRVVRRCHAARPNFVPPMEVDCAARCLNATEPWCPVWMCVAVTSTKLLPHKRRRCASTSLRESTSSTISTSRPSPLSR